MNDGDLEARRVLVTGGAGFIGSHIVEALQASGAVPIVLDDLSTGSQQNVPPGIETIEADVTEVSVAGLVRGTRPEIVIHAAAQVSVPNSVVDPARDRAVNLVGTENVLRGARASGVRRVVFASSGGAVYGEADGADEDQLPRPASPHGIHKLAAEGYLAVSGLPYGIARYANVYGPRQRADLEGGVVSIFCERLATGQPVTIFGSGEQGRDFVFVEDVARATIAIAKTSRSGTWNVGTGVATSVNSLLAMLSELIGPPAEVDHVAARAGDVAISRLSCDRVRSELGWRPRVTLREGLSTTIRVGHQGLPRAERVDQR